MVCYGYHREAIVLVTPPSDRGGVLTALLRRRKSRKRGISVLETPDIVLWSPMITESSHGVCFEHVQTKRKGSAI